MAQNSTAGHDENDDGMSGYMGLWQAYAELTILDIEEALATTDDVIKALAHLAGAQQHLDRAIAVLESEAEIPE